MTRWAACLAVLALTGCTADASDGPETSAAAASTAVDRAALAGYEGDWSLDAAGPERPYGVPERVRVLVTTEGAAPTLKLVDADKPALRAFDRADFLEVGAAEQCSTVPATREDPGLEVCHLSRVEAGALVHRVRAREARWLAKWSVATQSLRVEDDGHLAYRYVIDGKTEADLRFTR